MNPTEAKILVLCENLHTDLRYPEYISAKMGKSYTLVSRYIRQMSQKEWIRTTRYHTKKLVVVVQQHALERAKEVLKDAD